MSDTISGINLDSDGDLVVAVVLPLVSPARRSVIDRIGPWTVEMKEGVAVAVARAAADESLLAEQAGAVAIQTALDIQALGRYPPLATQVSDLEALTFCRGPNKRVLQIEAYEEVFLPRLSMTATVSDKHGKPLPPESLPPLEYHASLRYFRFARLADDPLVRARNLSLALESLLSKGIPQRRGEGDKAWFRRAVSELNSRHDFSTLPGARTDVVEQLVDEHYAALRCGVMHAKDGRDQFIPADPVKPVPRDILRLVEHVFRRVATAVLSAPVGAGGQWSVGVAERFLNSLVVDAKAAISEEPKGFDPADTDFSPSGAKEDRQGVSVVVDGFEASMEARFLPSEDRAVGVVRRLGVLNPAFCITHVLPGDLRPGVETEVRYTVRLRARNPRDVGLLR